MTAIFLLTTLGFFVGMLALGYRLGHHHYAYPSQPTRVVYVETSDKWSLGVEVHEVQGQRRGVVLTFHGLGLNHYCFDMSEGHSLVHYLQQRGYEVWNVDFRGYGHSKSPHKQQQQWGFDDHIRYDVPAILDAVVAQTGASNVHCIGHSMGGLVLYGYLATHPEEQRIASLCTLGASRVLCSSWGVWAFAWFGRAVTLFLPRLPASLWSQATAVFLPRPPFSIYVSHPSNFTGHVFRRRFFKMTESLCRQVFQEVTIMLSQQKLLSVDGKDNYEQQLSCLKLPVCFIGGNIDQLAHTSSIQEVHGMISSQEKELHVLGKQFGASTDYGHEDLLLAQSAQDEVYPIISQWLDKVSTSPLMSMD